MDWRQQNDKIFKIDKTGFDTVALDLFRYQYENNAIYRSYSEALSINPSLVQRIEQIPFLPISFFKTHSVKTSLFEPAAVFESSGTTGNVNSRHLIKQLSLYENSFLKCFEFFYGSVSDYCILGLLPSYLERKNSSLVYMVNRLIQLSKHPRSGFYLDEYDKLDSVLKELEVSGQKTVLIGVTFALLDFAERFSASGYKKTLQNIIIMETGGMKGRREEMVRDEVHRILREAFGVSGIHSEYGMTELLSQAYSTGGGIFYCPAWMKLMIRDEEDPLLVNQEGAGIINVIDLANTYSCSFIATDDIGKIYKDGSFEVSGRIDNSDLRGCSLMVV